MPLILSLLPLMALFGAIIAGVLTLGFSGDILLVALLFAAAVAALLAKRVGQGWDAVQAETGRQIADAFPAILILLSIGVLIGSWMFAGTIPLMVALGIDLINPQFMALTAFAATAIMSLISGTSWGSAGTIGVALVSAAEAMGLPLAPVAGAVVSGAYLGDKLSPLSDMTNISAIGAGADLYKHIRHMLWTSVPAAVIAAIAFAWIGFVTDASAGLNETSALQTRGELSALFNLNWLVALPLLVAIVGIVLRKPPVLVIIASSILALIIGVFLQGFDVSSAVATFVNGFSPSTAFGEAEISDNVTNLLGRGGMMSMAGTLMFIIAAFLLAAGMKVSGALDRLLAALLSAVGSVLGLVSATMAAGAVMVAMTSHGGVTALMVGGLFRDSYKERGLQPEKLSRSIEDSVTVTEPLMPWTVSGVFMASTLGVSTLAYAPWAIFCWLGPVASLVAAALYKPSGDIA
jgi:NhaC family Na+:H+ antiporter